MVPEGCRVQAAALAEGRRQNAESRRQKTIGRRPAAVGSNQETHAADFRSPRRGEMFIVWGIDIPPAPSGAKYSCAHKWAQDLKEACIYKHVVPNGTLSVPAYCFLPLPTVL